MTNHYKEYKTDLDGKPRSRVTLFLLRWCYKLWWVTYFLFLLSVISFCSLWAKTPTPCDSITSNVKSQTSNVQLQTSKVKSQTSPCDSLLKVERTNVLRYQVQMAIANERDSTSKYKRIAQTITAWNKEVDKYRIRERRYEQVISMLTAFVVYFTLKPK